MEIYKGIPASRGIAIGYGYIYNNEPITFQNEKVSDPDNEIIRLKNAISQAEEELSNTYNIARKEIGKENAEIFLAHQMILKDPELYEKSVEKIITEGLSADCAYWQASEHFAQTLLELSDEYLQARSADVRDVANRVIKILNKNVPQKSSLSVKSIILSEELSPSDTMSFDRELIAGFFTSRGGSTSHTAILARALGVPAVVAAGKIPVDIQSDVKVILDGNQGILIVDPTMDLLETYQNQLAEQTTSYETAISAAQQSAITIDHKKVEVVANIGSVEDAKLAVKNGAEGVGLFRTEFSFIHQNRIPTEEDLYKFYKEVLMVFGNRPIVFRTLDIGGDKEMEHLNLPVESNPFLGLRGIRLCLLRQDLFKPQLRAILRAGVNSDLRIMFPMVATIDEIKEARGVLVHCMEELDREKMPFNKKPQIGIMIEVPSAAICSDILSNEVDFFSIGTNDLTQYTMAVDRTNPKLGNLSSSFHPSVLRLIKIIIENAHAKGIWVGLCGEMASEPAAIPILLGLGLDEFSMNSPSIPQVKEIIRKFDTTKLKSLVENSLSCSSAGEVIDLVNQYMNV